MDFADHFAGNMRDFPGNVGLLSEDSRVSHVTLTGTLCVHRVLVVSPGVLMIQDHLGHLAAMPGDPMNPMFPLRQFRILGLHHVQSLMFCETNNHKLYCQLSLSLMVVHHIIWLVVLRPAKYAETTWEDHHPSSRVEMVAP